MRAIVILLACSSVAYGAGRLAQAPPVRVIRPPQGPPVRVFAPLKPAKAEPCDCSPACTCGCQDGEPCRCNRGSATPQTVIPVRQQSYAPATVQSFGGCRS